MPRTTSLGALVTFYLAPVRPAAVWLLSAFLLLTNLLLFVAMVVLGSIDLGSIEGLHPAEVAYVESLPSYFHLVDAGVSLLYIFGAVMLFRLRAVAVPIFIAGLVLNVSIPALYPDLSPLDEGSWSWVSAALIAGYAWWLRSRGFLL